MRMDSHSKNVCLVSILHMVGYLIETIRFIYIQYQHQYINKDFFEMLPLVGFYFTLAASFGLTILGVVKKRRLLFIPCFVVIALELIRPIKFYDHPDGFYIIALELLTIYPILTLFFELGSQIPKKPLEVTTEVHNEKCVDVLKENLCG